MDNLVTVGMYRTAVDPQLARSMLESHGNRAFALDEEAAHTYLWGVVPARVAVSAWDEARARRVLESPG